MIFLKKKKYLKIINVGRFTDQKNQMLILKTIKYLNNRVPVKLLIIGRGKNYMNLKNFIQQNKLEKKILLKRFVSNPYPFLKIADIFILSSNYEGLPNVLLEAQFFKKIIISTKCPTGPKEILLNGKAGLFFKMDDYKDLSRKIIYVYKNKQRFKKMIKVGYDNLHRFDRDKNLNKYHQTVLRLLDNEKN